MRDLAECLDGGQSFRWFFAPDRSTFVGSWDHWRVMLRLDAGLLQAAYADGVDPTVGEAALRHYLALDPPMEGARDALPWRSDPILREAHEAFPRLRILRQPPGEALLSFLCSATKQIPQIKEGLDQLARRFGAPLGEDVFALPTWNVLAEVPESALRACGLGFRARYIKAVAGFLRESPDSLAQWEELSDAALRERLQSLPGIGPKVADCVMLFVFHRLTAFPVDTWIARALREWYQLDGWSIPQMIHFGQIHFGTAAGLAQQLLFAHIRQQRAGGQKDEMRG